MNRKGIKIAEKIPSLLKRLGRFMFDSLYFSLYARMYRDLLLNTQKSVEYGEKAAKIMRENNDYSAAVDAIRQQVRVILEKEPAFRSSVENLFITGFMCQKNGFKDRLTKGWQAIQFNDLCRTFKITHVKPMKMVRTFSCVYIFQYIFAVCYTYAALTLVLIFSSTSSISFIYSYLQFLCVSDF